MSWTKISTLLVAFVACCAQAASAALINTYQGGSTEAVFSFYNGTPTPSVTATGSSNPFPASNGPNATVNGNGFWTTDPNGSTFIAPAGPTFRDSDFDTKIPEHSNGQGSWVSDDTTPVNQQWIAYNLNDDYYLDSLKVWNYYPPQHDRGLQNVYVWYSLAANPSISASTGGASPGVDWTLLGSTYQTFANTTNTGITFDDPFTINFGGVAAQNILFDIETNYGDTRVGLAEVQFFGNLVPPPAPEPSTMLLAGMGGLLLAGRRRKLRNNG